MLKMWDRKYGRGADFIVMESPFSGGHQGYKREELDDLESANLRFEERVRQTVELKKRYEEKYGRKIPLFVGGGIVTGEDTRRVMALGADGVQVGTRFIATKECDAYKQAFFNYMYLYDLKVNSEYQGRGVGKMLIKKSQTFIG